MTRGRRHTVTRRYTAAVPRFAILVGLCALGGACQRDAPPPPVASPSLEPIADLGKACDERDAGACERLAARLLIGAGVEADADAARRRRWEALSIHTEGCTQRKQASCDELPAHLRTTFADAPSSAAPVAAVPLDLPKAAGGNDVATILAVDITATGTLVVGGAPMADGALLPHAKTICAVPGTRVVIRADKAATHGRVITIVDIVKQAGCSKLAFGVSP